MVYTDESFLPHIVGLFYATFDPKLGPTVLHQVPENLITPTSQSITEEKSTTNSRSASTSHSRSRDRGRDTRQLTSSTYTNNGDRGRGVSHSRSRLSTQSTSRDSSTSRASSTGPTLLDFAPISEYIIPKKSLHGKLVTLLTTSTEDHDYPGAGEGKEEYRVMGFPSVLTGEGGRYQRNEYMWNLCFVFHASSSLEAFEPVVRKCGRILRSAELDSAYLSSPSADHLPLSAVLEQLFEDLNSYSETSINLDGFNSLELKLFPYFPNPPDCNDWNVPVALADLGALKDDNWDITAARVAAHIDGVNHVARIAQLADADIALVQETIRHMLYYQVVMMIDIFQYSNMYTIKPNISRLAADETIISECGQYVCKPGFPRPSWPALLRLYAKFLPGVTVHQWVERNNITQQGIDPRRFVSFGIIKGFLRRIHRWPIILDRSGDSPVLTDPLHSDVKRRVEFDKSTRVDSSIALSARTTGTNGTNGTKTDPGDSALTRSGPGDSTFTLRSQGSNMSLGVSPHGRTPSSLTTNINNKSPRRDNRQIMALSSTRGSLPRSMASGDHSSRKTPTGLGLGLGGSGSGIHSGMLRANTATRLRDAHMQSNRERLWEELMKWCDGQHHSDEIQVKFGLSWRDLEKVLGLESGKDGGEGDGEEDRKRSTSGTRGKRGVEVIYR